MSLFPSGSLCPWALWTQDVLVDWYILISFYPKLCWVLSLHLNYQWEITKCTRGVINHLGGLFDHPVLLCDVVSGLSSNLSEHFCSSKYLLKLQVVLSSLFLILISWLCWSHAALHCLSCIGLAKTSRSFAICGAKLLSCVWKLLSIGHAKTLQCCFLSLLYPQLLAVFHYLSLKNGLWRNCFYMQICSRPIELHAMASSLIRNHLH